MSLNNAHEGYDYQDLITSYFILEEILNGNRESIFSIDKKHTKGSTPDRFDDLVITNGDKIQRKQVKYSNEQTSVRLIKDYLSADSHYKLALHKLYESWKALNTHNTEFRLCLAWDEPVEENILKVLDLQPSNLSSFDSFPTKVFKININQLWQIEPEYFNRWDSLKQYVKENNIARDEFETFCEYLLIEVNLPKASLKFDYPNELEEILISQATRLGIGKYPNDDINTIDFLVRLVKYVGSYRTNSAVVTTLDVLKDLRIKTDFGKLQQKFEIDQSKNVKSDCRYSSFYNFTVSSKKVILSGEPGSGKSWFLTNFIDYLERTKINVLRHYCFTSTEDEFIERRVSSNTFFGNLISDIEKSFPELTKVKNQIFAANLDELNLLLQKIEEPLVIIVDGLDHINRVLSSSISLSKEKTQILESISQINIPDNVTIVLGSQPVEELSFLKKDFNYKEHQLPAWNIQDTKELVKKHGITQVDCNDEDIITLIHEKSEGNPLYLTYILLTLENSEVISKELIHSLPPYDFNLKKYYEYLTSKIENNTTAEILSCLDFSVTRKELQEIIPVKHHFNSSMKVLSPVISENTARGGVRLYHDSFRRFNMEKLADIEALGAMYEFIINWLNRDYFFESDKSYRYLFSYLMRTNKYEEISRYALNSFLPNSLYYAHSETLIRRNYESFLSVAKKTQNWSLFIYASELNRAINTTSSEEHHSQFLDNFELYFEAICLIYGVEKANALLYFNGEKNHSDSVTAQAFKILEKQGYSPNWKDVDELFSGRVTQDDFEYYISFFNQKNGNFLAFLKKTIQHEDKTYLRILLDEVFRLKGSDYIVDLHSKLTDIEKESTGLVINNLFERENCSIRIPIKVDSNVTLEPLSLPLISETVDEYELVRFCKQLELYSGNDLKSLISFEKTITCDFIAHSWIKFFIRNLIIDKTCQGTSLEESIIQSFSALADDMTNFPRARYSSFLIDNRSLIDKSFEQALVHVQSQSVWKKIFDIRREIVFPIIPTIENRFINKNNINFLIETYDSFDEEDSDYYEHAQYSFKKAIYRAKVGDIEKAKLELEKAILLTTSYTSRKDRNLSEVIDPLLSVNNINPSFAKEYTKKLKYLTDAVMKHTEDGKDTRWLTIEWFEMFIKVDIELATRYLINEMITNGYFWKLDFMYVDLLHHIDKVKPCILNFLYKLSPTNIKDTYLNGFLEVIERLEKNDDKLAKQSMVNLSARDWNDSYDRLSNKTVRKYNNIAYKLGLNFCIEESKEQNSGISRSFNNEKLSIKLATQLCKEDSLRSKSTPDLVDYLVSQDVLGSDKLNYLHFFFKEENNTDLANEILMPLIRKRFPRGQEYFTNLRGLIQGINLSDRDKVLLLVNNFVYSKDGWFSSFVDKDSLLQAVMIDRDIAQNCLASALYTFSQNKDYSSKTTANLIIAFEYVGFDEKSILSMYERGFDFIKSRLPDESEFEWENLDYIEISEMNDDERAITLLISKANNLDSSVQREIICALNYLIRNYTNLLTKPLSWFFDNFHLFHHSIIASVLELILIEINPLKPLLLEIKPSIGKLIGVQNLYIHNAVDSIFCELANE
ncbi:ATP-binding protein [Vibrio furnissii]|uniref:ATP-binding protein n=1 Tax=Vibrio furnissii TaxID=29494 RepID=UPI001E41DAED|nr:ATP-binding protein [Vibrio furnissii]UHJ59469.1 ATP-binding protein [Vibrio furnissii]